MKKINLISILLMVSSFSNAKMADEVPAGKCITAAGTIVRRVDANHYILNVSVSSKRVPGAYTMEDVIADITDVPPELKKVGLKVTGYETQGWVTFEYADGNGDVKKKRLSGLKYTANCEEEFKKVAAAGAKKQKAVAQKAAKAEQSEQSKRDAYIKEHYAYISTVMKALPCPSTSYWGNNPEGDYFVCVDEKSNQPNGPFFHLDPDLTMVTAYGKAEMGKQIGEPTVCNEKNQPVPMRGVASQGK